MDISRAPDHYLGRLHIPASHGGYWHLDQAPPAAPDGKNIDPERFVEPFVDDGRWLVGCPGCGGAQRWNEDHRWFMCCDCANQWAGGKWVEIRWSADHRHAERELSKRTQHKTANWRPWEQSWLELAAENIRHGVGDTGDLTKGQRQKIERILADWAAADEANVTVVKVADHLLLPDGRVATTLTGEGRALGRRAKAALEQAIEELPS